jgi:hypothetical protein
MANTAFTPRTARALSGLKDLSLSPNRRRPGYHGGEHAIQVKVEAELGAAVGFGPGVGALEAFADHLEVLCGLEFHLVRHLQQGRRLGELAVGQALAGGRIHHVAGFGLEAGTIHLPGLRGGFLQHLPRRGAGLAQLRVGVGHGGAAAGALHRAPEQVVVQGVVGGSAFHADVLPGHFQFLGHQGGQAGIHALAHLQMLDQHGHDAVRGDADEGVGGEGLASRSRQGQLGGAGGVEVKTQGQAGPECGAGLDEVAAGRILQGVHDQSPAQALKRWAAAWMPSRMRW